MGRTGVARDQVGDGIQRLEDRFGSFPVNQTTLRLSPAAYEDALDRSDTGVADLYVRVRNEDGEVLHVREDDTPYVPRYVGTCEEPLSEFAQRRVREETGVACAVDDVARVTIAGVRNAEDAEAPPVYRLLVLFEATQVGGTAREAVWRSEAETPEFV